MNGLKIKKNIGFVVKIFLVFSCYFCIFFPKTVFSQEFQGRFGEWNIFKNSRGDRVVCYVASIPIKSESKIISRGEPFFLVTNVEDDADEISASMGFIFNSLSDVELGIGSKKFYLFPYKIMAWASNKNDDIDIIKEMQKGGIMLINGVAKDGKTAVDTYSLSGFEIAYEKLKDICRETE